MDRNLALEFVRVTEAAAIECAKWLGKGDKIKADQAAVDAMRSRFNAMDFDGEVVIGEGEKDEAPLLYIGEKIGTGKGMQIDIAVDPLECTSNLANGRPNAITVLAAGPKGTLLKAPGTYMDQIAVGAGAYGSIDMSKSVEENLKNISSRLNKQLDEVTVVILDRPRHKELIAIVRAVGCRIQLIDHGTVSAGIAPCIPDSGIDVMMGVGGAPEAVITAAALKCLGGDMQGILAPHNDAAKKQAVDWGMDLDKIYQLDELAKGDKVMFAATGVCNGPLLNGVTFAEYGATSHSIVTRASSGTVRFIKTKHHFSK